MKNRTLIVVLIALVVVAAVLASFGLYLFPGQIPRVELPSAGTGSPQQTASPTAPGDGEFLTVEVTADTVQAVIATLSRADSYTRTLTVQDFWGEGEDDSSATAVTVWVDGGWTRTQVTPPSGRTQNAVIHGDELWLWYDRDRDYVTLPAGEHTADLTQRFPTYEDVLRLEPEDITDAGYAAYGNWNCVYAEAADRELGCLYRYWVDVGSGLLVAAETEQEGRVIYRMTASALQTPCPATASFRLPDGQVLHQVG